jgi:hypothetical protein
MPRPRLLRFEFSKDELREIRVALEDQIASLIRIDPAAYSKEIEVARTALAKTLQSVGQRPGDKCFLCRTPLANDEGPLRGRCPNGCEPPATWLRIVASRDVQ